MDVVRIAMERRESLHREVAKLDEFVRTAETLISSARPQSDSGQSTIATITPVQQQKAG